MLRQAEKACTVHEQAAMQLPPEFILHIDLEGVDLVEKADPINPLRKASRPQMSYDMPSGTIGPSCLH
jgi:hypothetical protein